MLLALLQQTDACFIGTQHEFQSLVPASNNYILRDINITDERVPSIFSSFLDCRNNTLYSEHGVFDLVEDSVIINCNFVLHGGFSNIVSKTVFRNINVTGVGNDVDYLVSGIYESKVHSSHFSITSSLTEVSFYNDYFGTRFDTKIGENSEILGVTENSQYDFFEYCYLSFDYFGQNNSLVSGLATEASYCRYLNLNVLYKAELGKAQNATVSSVCSFAELYLQLSSINIMFDVSIQEFGGLFGGAIALSAGDNIYLLNISLSGEVNINQNSSIETAISQVIAKNICFEGLVLYLTSYVNVDISGLQVKYGSLYADIAYNVDSLFSNCCIFGVHTMNVSNRLTYGGVVGQLQNALIENCAINLDILILANDSSYVGGFFAIATSNISVMDCQALGNLTIVIENDNKDGFVVGGFIGEADNVVIGSSYAVEQIAVKSIATTYYFLESSGFCGMLSDNSLISGCFVESDIRLEDRSNSEETIVFGTIAGSSYDSIVTECFFNGDIEIELLPNKKSYFGGIIGYSNSSFYMTIMILGEMKAESNLLLGTLFGLLDQSNEVEFAEVAINVVSQEPISFASVVYDSNTVFLQEILTDCRLGNHYVNDECANQTLQTERGTEALFGFSWQENVNDNYAVITRIVWPNENVFILPTDGQMSSDTYYLDSRGLPFPQNQMVICEFSCYGEYESPFTFSCENGNRFCVNNEIEATVMPNNSCQQENSICHNGVTFCDAAFEFIDGECAPSCDHECNHGICFKQKCLCDPYYYGDTCGTSDCALLSPPCYNQKDQICESNGECKCDDSRYYIASSALCVFGCQELNVDNGYCIAENTAVCINNRKSNNGRCDDCLEGFELNGIQCDPAILSCDKMQCNSGVCEDLMCECPDNYLSSDCSVCQLYGAECNETREQCSEACNNGHCDLPGSSKCTCNQHFAGADCSRCIEGYYLDTCVDEETCGAVRCYSHGNCTGDSLAPSCLCNNLFFGQKCEYCNDFGENCDLSQEACTEECCGEKENCNEFCEGEHNEYQCQCVKGLYGPNCNYTEKECDSEFCLGKGYCENGINITCKCSNNWEGKECSVCRGYGEDCEITQEQCDREACNGHGQCTGPHNNYSCNCNDLWQGENCGVCNDFGEKCEYTQEECNEMVCYSEGNCTGSFGNESCKCDKYFDEKSNCNQCKSSYKYKNSKCVRNYEKLWISIFVILALVLIAAIAHIIIHVQKKQKGKERLLMGANTEQKETAIPFILI